MRVYLDTSAVVAKLFGQLVDPARHAAASCVFELIEDDRIIGVISFYTLHELYWFCLDNFPTDQAKRKARLALLTLLEFDIELAPCKRWVMGKG